MNPIAMTILLAVALGVFWVSARRRWRLLRAGAPAARFDQPGRRLRLTLAYALGQRRMPRRPAAGAAHILIFFGFLVLLLRSLVLFARGYAARQDFGWWLFDAGTALGGAYGLLKDVFIVLVLLGVAVFFYYRVVRRLPRMTLGGEGLLILAIIAVMMIADVAYDAGGLALAQRRDELRFVWSEPLGSALAPALAALPRGAVAVVQHVGFWTHVSLVLLFLNLLPYTKHFHVITAIPNVYFQSLQPAGRLEPTLDIEGCVERDEPLGIQRADHLSWKDRLDLYTCTECGRCSEMCPATRTGKRLSPKHLILGLREQLYTHARALSDPGAAQADGPHRADLVPDVIAPEVLWACTTCRACEQECPVFISFVDKIVDLRRHLVQERGEVPAPLQTAFGGCETVASPYGVAADERMRWADGLDVPPIADAPDAEALLWVGCAPAFDERARNIARATVRLLRTAGVRFAVLGPEEQCTGDAARRAGNEYLFQMLAQANVETLNRYNVRRIVTMCPHCYNTLRHEYPDFGGRYEVVHHADLLAGLVSEGRLRPTRRLDATVVYHDSCYLGRYNGLYESPRKLLEAIPGVRRVEAAMSGDRGMCCGAGGAQMFKEEEAGEQRVNTARLEQLAAVRPDVIASACPFCHRMLGDALRSAERTDIRQRDVAELLDEAVHGDTAVDGSPAGGGDDTASATPPSAPRA